MDCLVYYRGEGDKLHSILAEGHEDVSTAFFYTEVYLAECSDVYKKPLLAILKGGKA